MNNKKIYIEAGANDGIFQSRSLHLSLNPNFFGILIEPTGYLYKRCIQNRNNVKVYRAALVEMDFPEKFVKLNIHDTFGAMNSLGHMDGQNYVDTEDVPARTLQSILDENSITEVEWLFLDTEGYELPILKGIDFQKTKFKNLEIECHYPFLKMQEEQEIEMFTSFLSNTHKLLNIIRGEGLPKLVFEIK